MSSARCADALQTFCRRVESLRNRRAVREGTVRNKFRLHFGPEGGEVTTDEGDTEDLRSFLLDVRPITMPKEPTYFPSVRSATFLHLSPEAADLHEALAHNQESWKSICLGHTGVSVDGQIFGGLDAFHVVLNADVFHDDLDKKKLMALPEPLPSMLRMQMRTFAFEASYLFWAQRNLIRDAEAKGMLLFPSAACKRCT